MPAAGATVVLSVASVLRSFRYSCAGGYGRPWLRYLGRLQRQGRAAACASAPRGRTTVGRQHTSSHLPGIGRAAPLRVHMAE
eukprot:scaffold97400_cov79-Phaeocystis_antarctica.AAC.2